MRVLLAVITLMCVSLPVYADVMMTIDEAYKVIDKKRVPFDKEISQIPKNEVKFLDHYFFVADMAMRARVMVLSSMQGEGENLSVERYGEEIEGLLSSFEFAQAPEGLELPERLLIEAISEQRAFFQSWEKARGTDKYDVYKTSYMNHPKVKSSHGKLVQAFYYLKARYPREDKHNLRAFEAHIVALDFMEKL